MLDFTIEFGSRQLLVNQNVIKRSRTILEKPAPLTTPHRTKLTIHDRN